MGNKDEIKSGIGAGFLPEVFGGKSFIHCVVELIKNARDWGATSIALTTQAKKFEIEIIDDGSGMNHDNRNAFASVNMTTASGPRQSGKFCTGTKQMLFSHCTGVTVVTAPEEEPDWVLTFSFSREEYEGLVLARGIITPKRVKKTKESWPMSFSFGTKIIYTLADPGSKGIYRGDTLATELAARLPLKFSEYVTVDGKPIPHKELVGDVYAIVETPPQLGEVRVELYHPAKRHREEGLRVTAVEVGEATIGNLFRVLTDDQREIFPMLFLLPEVCGTISSPFLKPHANEDRLTLSGRLADDPHTLHFLKFLRKIAPDVQKRLRITMNTTNESPDDAGQIDSVIDRFNNCFNPNGNRPKSERRSEKDDPTKETIPPIPEDPREQKPIALDCPSEVEIGKPFTIHGKIRKDLHDQYDRKDIHFSTVRSHSQVTGKTDGAITLLPNELGSGSVTADIPGTPYSTTVGFRVVSELIPRLSSTIATVKRGGTHLITVINKEKLPQGIPPRWTVTSEGGNGELKPEGYRAIFHATRNGHLVVTCTVESITLTCDIDVIDDEKLLPIEDQFFRVDTYGAEGESDPAARVATMHPGDENLHKLILQRTAPGYQEALQRGCLDTYLTLLIMREFARFKRVELEKRELDIEDVPSFLEEIEGHAQVLFETFLKHGTNPT